ncbi:GM22804 [Drosophila sechellia]|uniref:GM22804 n=1 Tax=Drosophila sechellia TaxID=7238 RepID=B4I6T7_DROSE|nr:GM22804 [Drosophila sechellia]
MSCYRKRHFLLWLLRAVCMLHLTAREAYATVGLQGVPTWIYLGLKSPFIEFGNQVEQLANSSIPTEHDQGRAGQYAPRGPTQARHVHKASGPAGLGDWLRQGRSHQETGIR